MYNENEEMMNPDGQEMSAADTGNTEKANFVMRDPETGTPAAPESRTGIQPAGQMSGVSEAQPAAQMAGVSEAQPAGQMSGATENRPTEQTPADSGNRPQDYRQMPYGGQSRQQNPYEGQPQGQGYPGQNYGQVYQGPSYTQYHVPVQQEQKKKREKAKKPGIWKKAAGVTAAALLFGFVAGGTMVGVNMLADSMDKETTAATIPTVGQQQEQVTLSDEELDKIAGRLNLYSDQPGTVAMDVSAIVEDAMPSVVAINNTMLYESVNPWFGRTQTYEVPSAGSGIIVGQNDTELLVATNNHVVEDASELSVVFIDDTELEASVKGADPESDLAIVAVPLESIPAETMNKISIAQLGDSEELKIGQGVIAIGNALGYGQAVTVGYVSALNREVKTDGSSKRLIQTDAAINPGNSGGALLNMQGEVIGINEAKYSDTDVEGMGFAIPISQAQDILDSLMVRRGGEKVDEDEAGYLGIQGVTVDDTMQQQLDMPAGVYVYRIVEGGAAEKTDLHEKDVITQFDGQRVMTMASLQELLKYYKKGETVELVVESLTDGEYVERTISITLGGQVSAE